MEINCMSCAHLNNLIYRVKGNKIQDKLILLKILYKIILKWVIFEHFYSSVVVAHYLIKTNTDLLKRWSFITDFFF